ncbi:MAG: sigma-70 family RNA polymerase sigma factor [Bdellovibrionales bacterium]|nr:sigma-70 family RNA polymerase sigma factor [Bdellovibrionales bacterium]
MDTNTAVSDEELVQRFLNGRESGFAALVERYEQKVYNTALHLSADEAAAEEVLAEVFIELDKQLRTDSGKTPIFPWLIGQTLERAVARLAHSVDTRRTEPPSQLSFEEHCAAFERRHAAIRHALREAVLELPPATRHVFALRDIHGMAICEISQLLAMDEFEVRSSLRFARQLVRGRLKRILPQCAA